jgi:polyhydroxyalkanoate synthesis regulator phasin
MPAPKRSTSSSKTSSAAKPAAKRTRAAAKSGAKATATSTRKAASRTATQAKSGATKTAGAAKAGATKTTRSARSGGSAASTAKTAGRAAASTAKAAGSGARGTATAARRGAKQTASTAKRGATTTRRASGGSESLVSIAEQLARGTVKPRDVIMLTRDRIQEILDDAASRGRVTRKDANDLVAELVRRGRQQSDDILGSAEGLVERGKDQIEAATKRARKAEPVDRIVRGADRARRAAGVGPSFPILGYDDLTAAQVQSRLAELKKPELRKVLTYERNNANRKTVTGALEKAIG